MNNIDSIQNVIHNSDLRYLIFSYLRKYPKIKCEFCNCVCVWDLKVKNYYELPNFYNNSIDYTNENKKYVYCQDCLSKYQVPSCEII